MKIIADTASLIPPSEGNTYGLTVMPVCVAINNPSTVTAAAFAMLVILRHTGNIQRMYSGTERKIRWLP